MTKRNRLDDFHALQGMLGTKTLKIDVNHGSARRGLLGGVRSSPVMENDHKQIVFAIEHSRTHGDFVIDAHFLGL